MECRQSVHVGGVDVRPATEQPHHLAGVSAGAGRQEDAVVVELDGRQLPVAGGRAGGIRLRTVPSPKLVLATPQRVLRLDKFIHREHKRQTAARCLFYPTFSMKSYGNYSSKSANTHT